MRAARLGLDDLLASTISKESSSSFSLPLTVEASLANDGLSTNPSWLSLLDELSMVFSLDVLLLGFLTILVGKPRAGRKIQKFNDRELFITERG